MFEEYTTNEILEAVIERGRIVSSLEAEMNEASKELEKRGTSIEKILKEREKENGKT